MHDLIRAKEPFVFYTRQHLTELTGLRATTLSQLLALIKNVPGSCIYHHTHRFLQQHQYLSPEPPNDFAYWVSEILGEAELGERLASIDTVQFSNIRSLRERIIIVIDEYLKNNKLALLKFAKSDEAFHFMKSISFVLPLPYAAHDLAEFLSIFKKITIDSIYYHIFESKLRIGQRTNDFSAWFEHALENKKLAGLVSRLDPYTRTLEDLRKTIIHIIETTIF
jgi:hypothetical protein